MHCFVDLSGNKQSSAENIKEKSLVLACDSYQEAESWVNAIEGQIQYLSLKGNEKNHDNQYRSKRHIPHPEVRLDLVEKWITAAKWSLFGTHEGYCLLRHIKHIHDFL